jgi:hypothetical protein
LLQQIRVCGKDGNDDVGLKTDEQRDELLLDRWESLETFVEIFLPIEPAVNVAPGVRPSIDQSEISLADEFVELGVSLGKEIMQFDFCIGCYSRDTIANAAGGAVVTFPKAGADDQKSFHNSFGESVWSKADGTLMDICMRQSKLSTA